MSAAEPSTPRATEPRHSDIVAIIVNTERKTVPSPVVSYIEVVTLAYPTPPGPDIVYTVMFRNALAPQREGSLVDGQTVTVKEEGTIFNVRATGKS